MENLRGSLLQNQGSNHLKHIIVMKSKKLYRIHSLGESLAVWLNTKCLDLSRWNKWLQRKKVKAVSFKGNQINL